LAASERVEGARHRGAPPAPPVVVRRPAFVDTLAARWLLVAGVAMITFGYQLTTPILLSIGVNMSDANFMIKAVTVGAFTLLAAGGLAGGKTFRMRGIILLAFMIILGARLLYDVMALDILPIFQSKFYVLSTYFALTIIPVFAILLVLHPKDMKRAHNALYWLLVAANVALVAYIATGGIITSENVFAGRFEVRGDVESTSVLNPIGVGMVGASLASIAIGRLTALRSMNVPGQLFTLAMIILGIANMFTGGSRGPALGLAFVLLVTVYTLIRGLPGGGLIRPRMAMWIYGGVVAAAFAAIIVSQAMSIQVFDRFTMMFEARMAGGREERDYALETAFLDFLGSPFFGSGYLTSIGRQFPHNIVVDALMATGVVGFAVFFVAMFWTGRGLLRMIHGHAGAHGFGIAMVAICVLTLGMTSGAAVQSPDFWAVVAMVIVLGNVRRPPSAPTPSDAATAAPTGSSGSGPYAVRGPRARAS